MVWVAGWKILPSGGEKFVKTGVGGQKAKVEKLGPHDVVRELVEPQKSKHKKWSWFSCGQAEGGN